MPSLRHLSLICALVLAPAACDLEASQRAFQPGAHAHAPVVRARIAWTKNLPLLPPSDDALIGDDLDLPMGAEPGLVIPSACGACGCLRP